MFVIVVSRGHTEKKNPLLGIFEMDQAMALQSAGHKVILISIDLRSIRRRRKLGFSHLYNKKIEVYNFSFPLGRMNGRILLFFGQYGINKIYNTIVKKHGKPDIVHAHFSTMAAIAIVLKKKYAVPFVITEHNSQLNKDQINKQIIFWGNIAYKYADKVIAVSPALAENIKRHFSIESIIIPNIVDTLNFKIQKKNNDKFTFISVGSLIYRKGFDLLINAFHQSKFDKNISLSIIGEGNERKSIESQIANLKLTGQVRLLGQLSSREEIQQNFSTSSAFVLASRVETFGVAYIEAMAAGLPVIATRCGGPEYFVNQENGILVEVDDIIGLSNAMKCIYEDINNYDPYIIQENVINKFSPEVIAKQLSDVYQYIIGGEAS